MLRLDPVPTLTGLPEWGTYQGNASHTGYVPVTLDPTHFVAQWSWNNPSSATGTLTPATTGSGKVVLASSGYFSQAYLYTLNESDGSLAWQYDFGSIFAVNHPAVADGRVFVASSGHEDTFMWSFDVNDGTFKYKTPFSSQWEHYLAPVIKDGYVFTDGGYGGGIYRFKERTGQLSWIGALEQYELWSPAIDEHYAYAYTGYSFTALDVKTGTTAFTVSNPSFNWWGYSLNIAPVLPGDGSVILVDGVFDFGYAHSNNLIRYSVSGQNESWRVSGSFASDPVVANGTLYVINAATNALEARDLPTGQLLWLWTPTITGETLNVNNIVLTDNLVFVSTTSGTRAINLSTHQSVWSISASGHLTLSSNKKLYIVADQRVDAINLD
jgi:outer membrane protein assembly factor BamB